MINSLLKNPLYKFLVWLLFGLLICFYGITHTLALTNKTIYSDSGRTNSNKYLYGSNPNGSVSTGSVGSNISGESYGFSFWLNENIVLNKTYTLKVNFMGDDLYNTFSSNFVTISTCYSNTCNDNIIISIEKSTNSGRSTWLQIKFNPASTGDYLYVGLSSDTFPLPSIAGPVAFGIYSVQIESTNESQNIIDNQTNNTNNIIDNNNQNTQDIIDNQNENTQNIIEENKKNYEKCTDKAIIEYNKGKYFNNTGQLIDNSNTFYSDLIYVKGAGILTISNVSGATYAYSKLIIFDKNKKFVDWYELRNRTITLSDDIYYIAISSDIKTTQIDYQNEVCINRLDEQNNSLNGINDSINDDNVDSSSWANFFNNFTTNTFGLTSIITAPLNLIQSLTNTSCSDLQIPLPYLNNKYLTLPCMSTIYFQYFGSFFTLYQTITYGIIAYWVCVRLFNLVKDFKNPEHDEIEVVDL